MPSNRSTAAKRSSRPRTPAIREFRLSTRVIKYMCMFTAGTVCIASIAIFWQVLLLLKQRAKLIGVLTRLLAIEASLQRSIDMPVAKVALGYGACTDLLIPAMVFFNVSDEIIPAVGEGFTLQELRTKEDLRKSFAYYFQRGAAAERFMPNRRLFRFLINNAKREYPARLKWSIGGNAPLMAIRFNTEGSKVLLAARMSDHLRVLVPQNIEIYGSEIDEDDTHIILEYKAGDTWGPYTAPRANRYILHSDENNPHLVSMHQFDEAIMDFQPQLFVVSGLQMMDKYDFEAGVRESLLLKVHQQIVSQSRTTLQHFEMASYVEAELLQQLRKYVIPFVDSLGMNEQELDNLRTVMKSGHTSLAADSNPRVATVLDQMRELFLLISIDFYKGASLDTGHRFLSRIHLHTLAYQALLTVRNSKWLNLRAAAAKASLTAYRYVCQNETIDPDSVTLILDDSFATSTRPNAKRMYISMANPVPCWTEEIEVIQRKSIEVDICVAPVLVCPVAKKTAGAGDTISAAALAMQL